MINLHTRTIRGTASDASDIASVTVNGEPANGMLTHTSVMEKVAVRYEPLHGTLTPTDAAIALQIAVGAAVLSRVGLPVIYDGMKIDLGIPIGSSRERFCNRRTKRHVNKITPVHGVGAAFLPQARSGKRIGLLINFNAMLLKDGITRRIN